MKFLLGRKIGMTQIFDEDSRKVTGVTLLEVGPNTVLQRKTTGKDGYEALQLGFGEISKDKKKKKSAKGKEFAVIKEFRSADDDDKEKSKEKGEVLDASVFQEGDTVKVSAVSKGKGFQGAVKRWGFSGRKATHGVKHEHRTLGSVGSQQPQRVIKGKKMPGQTGRKRVTTKNIRIVQVIPEQNIIAVRGAVPGGKGTVVEIRSL